VQTCLGAAQMALNTNENMSDLRKNVTSKKGITYEALNIFEQFNIGGIVDKAIQANIARAQQLAIELTKLIDN
ncbi:pyrroline-5-carboxylate reductase family protein, partial [Francisella tularensis]|uniref:pyrroline-5-carboxylate reductase family protein n=1 Tax=Francisella tularensis TaxID=263 RepID=UPI002381A702